MKKYHTHNTTSPTTEETVPTTVITFGLKVCNLGLN